MPLTHNYQIQKEILRAAKLQPGTEQVPQILSSQIVPVIDVNPHSIKDVEVVHAESTGSGSTIFLTAPTKGKLYITGTQLSMSKDAACDTDYCYIRITKNGENLNLIGFRTIPLVADAQSVARDYTHAICVDAGTDVRIYQNRTVGSLKTLAIVNFYIDDSA